MAAPEQPSGAEVSAAATQAAQSDAPAQAETEAPAEVEAERPR